MKHILNGLRAGVIAALALTLWSFLGASAAMDKASEATGFYYILTAFGLLGLPQVIFGAILGALTAGWAALLGEGFRQKLRTPATDRRTAAILLTAPVLAVVVGAGVGALHVAVTAKFVRTSFQALGLTLGAGALCAGILAASPLVYGAFGAVLGRIFPDPDDEKANPRATLTVLGVYALGVIGAVIFGYQYAAGLDVWDTGLLRMGVAAAVLTPVLFVAMLRIEINRIAWRVGIPVAGAIAVVVCFFGAFDWASISAPMRRATTRESELVAATARALKPLADHDGDGYASGLGGIDCDDTNPHIYPGAQEKPGNGIDEDCSGADAPPPGAEDSQAYKIVHLGIDSARTAAAKKAANIPDPPKNLVFILVDTLRADHVHFYGYKRHTTPNIDKVAQDSSVFMHTYAAGPHTPRSIPMIFFGRYPSRTKWRHPHYNYPIILPENLGLFEVLNQHGWYNIGESSHHYFSKEQGIRQGFDDWDNSGAGTIAESNDDTASPRIWKKVSPEIDKLAQRWKTKKKPFALFIHLFEPHARWISHKGFEFKGGPHTVRQHHVNDYDSEVAFADSYVGRIVDKLKATGLYDNAVFVLTADHGEGFDEHGYYFHGQTLYNEVLHVPLIIHVPGWHSRKIDGSVSLLDIAPTLLELFNVSIPSVFEGRSLVETMLGHSKVPDRPIFSELLPYTNWKEKHEAIIKGHKVFMMDLTNGVNELYDLAKDPGEKHNLVSKKKKLAKRLKKRLYKFMQGK